MKRTYKKKSNLINKTGYTPGYDTEKNPVNYIPSEDITMANTPYPLYATPLDESGNPIGKGMTMQPGGEYKFPGAAYVAETPMFERGGEKRDWISAKISKLVREEGYPQKQAVAMAYEMYDNMHKNGGYQLPMYQIAGTYNFGSALPKPKFSADPNIQSPEAFSASLNKITEVNPGEYGLGKDPNYVNALSTESLTAGEDFKKRTDEINKAAGLPQTFSPNVLGAEVEDTKESTATTGLQKPDIKTQEPFQFFNPYGGVDIPSANVMFGQSLENKDTLGAIASGAKIALGTARNILGGMGQARRENYVKQQYYEKQREGMTGAGREEMKKFGGYYQDGGMEQPQGGDVQQQVVQALQQGMSPEEVMQQLVQMGMPEEQAMSLIQGIMQQMQGSTPQLRRGGTMYYQDGGEEDEEEYEDLINKYPNRNPNISRVEDTENKTDWYEEDMDRDTYYGFKNQLESSGYKSVPKEESKSEENKNEQKEESYDKNSARDTWVAKTGMPWSEAKRLGYTSGSAKDNMKLLSELNDPRFKKDFLRKKPLSPAKSKIAEDNKTYYGGTLRDVIIEVPRKKAGASRFMFTSDKAYQDYLKDNKIKQTPDNATPIPTFDFNPKPQQPMFRQAYQDGGEQQVAQQVAQAMQQGMQPQEAMSMLMESGMTEDQAVQMVQAIMQQLEQQPETPQLRRGGYYQEGGMEPGADPAEAMMQQVSQMLQQGAEPEQIMQMLIEAGVPEDQAMQMVQAVMQQMEEPQGTPQMRDGGIPERYKKMGFSKVGAKKQSTSPGKKWMVLAKKGDQYKIVHGGDSNMKDFSQHGSEARKENFWNRMGGRDSAKANDPFSPLYWHKKFGTWQEGGEMMDEEMEGENEAMENESAMLEQVEAQVEQALKQGADPQQVLQQLVQMGIPQEVAQQMIEEILQEIQGGETGMEAPEEATPQMSKGGKYMRALVGKTIKNYTYNPKTDSYIVSYE